MSNILIFIVNRLSHSLSDVAMCLTINVQYCVFIDVVATVSFNQTEYRVNEGVGTSAIWVELKNDLELNAEVR